MKKVILNLKKFWQKLLENEGIPLLVLSLLGCLLATTLMLIVTNFLHYLHHLGTEELRNLVQPWREFLLGIFFYSYLFFLALLFFGIFLSLVLFLLDLLGFTAALTWGLAKGFVTELFYWIDRVKKLLKRYVERSNKRL